MALVSFGGGGDPSGLFASLNRQHLQDIEALAERATNRANERSDAEDRDMFDKWQNGLIDDDAWLAYIEERVVETAGDPKEHQQWIETQRQYETSIADNKMEFAYENGQATINQIIEYYRGRLDRLDKDSQAYREIHLRLNQYVDKRSGEDIQTGAQDITDRIVMGKASIGDLISFYQSRLSSLRPNSSLYDQIKDEIRDLQSQQIRDEYSGASAGGSGGGGGGGRSRSSGGGSPSYGSAAQQYEAATASGIVPRNSATAAALLERDNLGVSAQARQFGGVLPGMSEGDSDDYIQGARAHAEWMLKQFAEEDTDSIIIDPNTGMEWDNTPENAQIWAYEYIDLSEMRARGQETGRSQDYSIARQARNDIGDAVLLAQQANAIPVQEAEHRVMAEYNRQIAIAEASGDPVNVLRVNSTFGRTLQKMGEQAIINEERGHRRGIRPGIDDTLVIQELKPGVERIPEAEAQRLISTGRLFSAYGSGDVELIVAAQQEYRALPDFEFDLVDSGPEIWEDLDVGIAPSMSSPASISMAAIRMRDGVESGQYMRVYDPLNPGDGIAIVPTVVSTSFDAATGRNIGRQTPISGNFNPANGDRWERIYTDDRNGNPVETWVISRLQDIGLGTYVAGSGLEINGTKYSAGTTLTESIIGGMSDEQIGRLMSSGQIKLGSAGQVRSYSYRYGNQTVQAYWNEELQAWTEIPYMRQGLNLRSAGGRLAVILSDDGTLGGHMRSYAHLQARPIQYHGSNPQKFQEMVNNGEIAVPHWGYKVDETGKVTAEENPHRMYWYDERIVTKQRGMYLNGALVQWADPDVIQAQKKEDREIGMLAAGMSDPKDRANPKEVQKAGMGGLEDSLLGQGIGALMGVFGITQGDPNGRADLPARSRGGSWADDAARGESAFARVQAAARERARQEASAQAARKITLPIPLLPAIPLPKATGAITPRASAPALPAPPVRTAPPGVDGGLIGGGTAAPIYRAPPPPPKAPVRTSTPQHRTTGTSGGARVI